MFNRPPETMRSTHPSKRIIESSVQELKFNILQDVRYEAVRVAADLACQRSAVFGKLHS
jgi:hypothetical protein